MMPLEGVDIWSLPLPRHLQMNCIYSSAAFSFGDPSQPPWWWHGGCGFARWIMPHSHLMPLMFLKGAPYRHFSSRPGSKGLLAANGPEACLLAGHSSPTGPSWPDLVSRLCVAQRETKGNQVLVNTIPGPCNHQGWTLDSTVALYMCSSSHIDVDKHPL